MTKKSLKKQLKDQIEEVKEAIGYKEKVSKIEMTGEYFEIVVGIRKELFDMLGLDIKEYERPAVLHFSIFNLLAGAILDLGRGLAFRITNLAIEESEMSCSYKLDVVGRIIPLREHDEIDNKICRSAVSQLGGMILENDNVTSFKVSEEYIPSRFKIDFTYIITDEFLKRQHKNVNDALIGEEGPSMGKWVSGIAGTTGLL